VLLTTDKTGKKLKIVTLSSSIIDHTPKPRKRKTKMNVGVCLSSRKYRVKEKEKNDQPEQTRGH
jgi:hypothetical protein